MRNIHFNSLFLRKTAWLLLLILCLGTSVATADGVLPKMPAPPTTPVYWQLKSIEYAPEVNAANGYAVHHTLSGLELDLEDGLLTESRLEGDDAAQGITLVVEKNDEVVMEHSYIWSPLPIYIEPDTSYPITVTGTSITGGIAPNSLLGIYEQGEMIARISAGAYTGHDTSISFDVNTDAGIYKDGSLIISFVLRDVNDMFRGRIAFTYRMSDGVKPVPTPVPGFVATEIPDESIIPAHYVPVEGRDDLWQIITAPEEYRAYGVMSGSEPAFFPADANGSVVMDEHPADAAADFEQHVRGFVQESPDGLPEHYSVIDGGLYTFTTRDGETITRAYGRVDGEEPAYYPVQADGTVNPEDAPVDPAADFEAYIKGFGAADLEGDAPAHYTEENGVYAFSGRDGQRRYRAYGRMDGAEPAFYPSDESGSVAADAKVVTPEEDFEAYIKGFDIVEVPEAPEHYIPVTEGFFVIEDREGNPVYRVYGIKDGGEPAFYPATEDGEIASEDAQSITPEEDFETHVAGFDPVELPAAPDYYEETEVPGVFAFLDKDGQSRYRVYGKLHRGDPAFYPSDAEGNVEADALPINPASDLALMPPPVFSPARPDAIPSHYGIIRQNPTVYSFTDADGNVEYRVYGAYGKAAAAFYPSDAEGTPVEDSEPIDAKAEYAENFGSFVKETPEAEPEFYSAVEGKEGVYTFVNKDGQTEYRVYGNTGKGEAAFYPSDAEGNIISGTPLEPGLEYEEQYGSFSPATREELPRHYAPVAGQENLYSFTDAQGNTEYRVHGTLKADDEPAFYPATADGRLISAEKVDPDAEYEARFGGFAPATVEEIPAHYEAVEGQENLFTFNDSYGNPVYRVYGSKEEGEAPAFYPADAEGNIISGIAADMQMDAQKLPMTISGTVSTPIPAPEVETTPLVRTKDGETSRWTDPNAPAPTQYIANVSPAADATDGGAQSVSKVFTPAPDASADPLPTEYSATVIPQGGDGSGTAQTVSSTITGAPEATATLEATQTPVATKDATEEPAATDTPKQESNATRGIWMILAIAGILILLIIAVVIIVSKRKSK